MFRPFLARQFGKPSGPLGGYMARVLNNVNARANQIAFDLMQVQPAEQVLDVGFGGGLMLGWLIMRVTQGFVAGIEISEAMLKRVGFDFRDAIQQGKLEIKRGDVSAIPYSDGRFNKVCTINTLHFWPQPEAGLREIHRVLAPGGLFVLAVRPKGYLQRIRFTQYGFAAFEESQLKAMLESAGFVEVHVEQRADKDMGAIFGLGHIP
jgi:ubiquinone/menaquinone biosynthesis C-methylase UbiE